ncbi:hypothetical protein ACW4TY_31715 [Streptomyces reniochalinae]
MEEAVQEFASGGAWGSWRLVVGLLLCPAEDAAHAAAVREAQEGQHCVGQMDFSGQQVLSPDRLRIERITCEGHYEEVFA